MANTIKRYGFEWTEKGKKHYRTYDSFKKMDNEMTLFLYGNGFHVEDIEIVKIKGVIVEMRILKANKRNSKVYYVPH